MTRGTSRQRLNDLAQSGQGLVDAFGFVEGLALGASFCDSLRACQIDEVKLANFARQIRCIVLGNGKNEDRVGATRLSIHIGCTGGSSTVAKAH